MNTKLVVKQLEKRRAAIGAERDKLREIVDEFDGLLECCERADENLASAIDALSELA